MTIKESRRGEDLCLPLPPPMKMSEGSLTHGNCRTNRAQSPDKASSAVEKERGRPGGAGFLTYILFLNLHSNGKINPQEAEYITCSQ